MSTAGDEDPASGNEFREWLSSDPGQLPTKASDTLRGLLEGVELAMRERAFLWPDGTARSFEESVAHLHQQEPQLSATEVTYLVIDWMEDPERLAESATEEVSGAQLAELARVLDEWIAELDQKSASS
jgi:hypothetical protein